MHLCWKSEGEDPRKGNEVEKEGSQGSRCDYCGEEIMGEEGMEEHKMRCWEEVYGRRKVDKMVDKVVDTFVEI